MWHLEGSEAGRERGGIRELTGTGSHRRHPRHRVILIGSFILIKALILFALWTGLHIPGNLSASGQVFAREDGQSGRGGEAEISEETESSAPVYPKDLLLSIQKEREALRKREEALNEREAYVQQEEARFRKIQQEVEEKVEALAQLQASLHELIREKKSLENEILKRLAKVYESTPPEQAGPMLSSLDVKLAAQILIRMDGRKAGKIWGFVSPERASQISSEIARLK